MEYVKRATDLADQRGEVLERELMNRFIGYMTDGGNDGDTTLQWRIQNRMFGTGLLTDDGLYADGVTFEVVRNACRSGRQPILQQIFQQR